MVQVSQATYDQMQGTATNAQNQADNLANQRDAAEGARITQQQAADDYAAILADMEVAV